MFKSKWNVNAYLWTMCLSIYPKNSLTERILIAFKLTFCRQYLILTWFLRYFHASGRLLQALLIITFVYSIYDKKSVFYHKTHCIKGTWEVTSFTCQLKLFEIKSNYSYLSDQSLLYPTFNFYFGLFF